MFVLIVLLMILRFVKKLGEKKKTRRTRSTRWNFVSDGFQEVKIKIPFCGSLKTWMLRIFDLKNNFTIQAHESKSSLVLKEQQWIRIQLTYFFFNFVVAVVAVCWCSVQKWQSLSMYKYKYINILIYY